MKNKFKNVVIFGASQGIGEALASAFAADGSSLVLLSRNEKAIEELTHRITLNGNTCYYSHCDITNNEDVAK